MTATLRSEFETEHAQRAALLERARLFAALTIPSVLPPENSTGEDPLVESNQSLGARGVANLENRLIAAIHPPGSSWFRFQPSIAVKYDPGLSTEELLAIEQQLYIRELQVQSHLDTTSYRSKKRIALRQLIVTGNSLTWLKNDYRIKNFRLDQFVGRRDGDGEVLFVITKELVDPLGLPPEVLAKAEVPADRYEGKSGCDRQLELYTRCQWQRTGPRPGVVITQQLNDRTIAESHEPVSPFFWSRYDEIPGEPYGRGLVELNRGDLVSFDALCEGIVDWSDAASRLIIGVDPSANVSIKDVVNKPNGSAISCKVGADGKIAGVGFLHMDKFADFQVTKAVADTIEKRLGKAMLLESELQPQGERVTAYQVSRIAQELQGALGGVYAQIADEEQRPFLQRYIWQLERDKLLQPVPKGAVQVQLLTGLEALGRENELNKLLGAVQAIAQLGPEAIQRLNIETVLARLLQLMSVDPTGLTKSREQLEQEAQAMLRQQLQAAAGEQAVKTTGNIVEAAATQGATAPAQRAA